MSAASPSEIIEREVVDGQRALTAARLAALADCSHDDAAGALAAALADSPSGQAPLHAVYFVCGGGEGAGVTVRLVPADRLDEAKAAAPAPLRACHVYAVAPKRIDNVSVLYDDGAVPPAPRRPAADEPAAEVQTATPPEPHNDGGGKGRGVDAAGSSSAPLPPATKTSESKTEDVAADSPKEAEADGADASKKQGDTGKTNDYNSSCMDLFTTGDDEEDDWGGGPTRSPPPPVAKAKERAPAAKSRRSGTKRKRPAAAADAALDRSDGGENADAAPAADATEDDHSGSATDGRPDAGGGVHLRAAAATFVDTDGFLVTRKVSAPVAKTEPAGGDDKRKSDKLRPTQTDRAAKRPAAASAKAGKKAPAKQQASLTAFFKKQ